MGQRIQMASPLKPLEICDKRKNTFNIIIFMQDFFVDFYSFRITHLQVRFVNFFVAADAVEFVFLKNK